MFGDKKRVTDFEKIVDLKAELSTSRNERENEENSARKETQCIR